jgi:hypothetical protein
MLHAPALNMQGGDPAERQAEAQFYQTAFWLFREGWGLFAIAGLMWRVLERLRDEAPELPLKPPVRDLRGTSKPGL